MSYRVLVVDDDQSVREVLRDLLTIAGYDVETAEDGRQAWERLQHDACDCVLADLRMPNMDGLSLYQAVKWFNLDLARRIVFCTGEMVEGYLEWFLKGTGNRLLLKPFLADRLLEICGDVCSGRRKTVPHWWRAGEARG